MTEMKKLGDYARIAILCITSLVLVAPASAGERPACASPGGNAVVESCRPSLACCLGGPVLSPTFMAQATDLKARDACVYACIDKWGAVGCEGPCNGNDACIENCRKSEINCINGCAGQ